MKGSIQEQEFKNFLITSDFNLACTLYYLGFDIRGIDKGNKRRVRFFFEQTTDLESSVSKYFKKQIMVEPLVFDLSRREMQAQIHTKVSRR